MTHLTAAVRAIRGTRSFSIVMVLTMGLRHRGEHRDLLCM
jgi:hypothetical protein